MSIERTEESLQDHLRPGQPSTDPKYLVWKKAKIQQALEQSKDRSRMIPAHQIWKEFGLEH